MKNIKITAISIALGAIGFLGSTAVMAQSSMQAKVKLGAMCEISAPSIQYSGDLSSMKAGNPYYHEFNLQVKCNKGTPYKINDTQVYENRPMTGATTGINPSLLYYVQWLNGATWAQFGSKAQGASFTIPGTGTGTTAQHKMRVRIFVAADGALPTPDTYSASTVVQVTF